MYKGEEPLKRSMFTTTHRKIMIFAVAVMLAVAPFYRVSAECQKLGEFCGSPPSDTFPSCCPFDTGSDDEQVPLKCKNVDNGVGTCEVVEEADKDSAQSEE